MKLNDYAGIIHFHSEYSFDGRIAVADIVKAAHINDIDFLMLTDHGTLKAKEEGLEGWHGTTLLIVGQEISPRFNHYLVFNAEEPIWLSKDDETTDPQSYISKAREQGGLGFIAHPHHEGAPMFHVKHYPWKEWGVTGFDGIGVWDFMTDWQSSLTGYGRALLSYLFPMLYLAGPKEATLKRWDLLNQTGKVVGIAECDNHNSLKGIGRFRVSIFPFVKAFRYLRTHVLTDEPLSGNAERDIALLLSSLKRGRAFMAQENHASARGFSFIIDDGHQVATIGDDFFLTRLSMIRIGLPDKARVVLLKDGVPVHEKVGDQITFSVETQGVYRVEAYQKIWGRCRPWIFSNPIYVK
jgi:hypothetical protein